MLRGALLSRRFVHFSVIRAVNAKDFKILTIRAVGSAADEANNKKIAFGESNNKEDIIAKQNAQKASLYELSKAIKMLRRDLQSEVKMEKREQQRLELETKDKTSLALRVWNKLKDPRELARLIWVELVHVWHGFRLFGLEAKLSAKYLWKLVRGEPLLRKERQQMIRTTLDIVRIVPFSVFVLVPFLEFLFPLYIKLFPKMMPSTFHDVSKEEENHRKQLKLKVETARLLTDTLEEVAMARKEQGLGLGKQAVEFAKFLRKIRTGEGGYVNNEELFKFIKLFEDELTLDNLSMVQLRALCRLLGIAKLGTPEILRFRLRMKLNELKADDRLIEKEGGVDVLSAQELQAACRARGMRALGLSEDRLRQQLKQWVELSLDDQVPPSLLLLSRAMYFPEDVDFTARIRSIIGTLPKEIGDLKAIELKELGGETDRVAKIELLRSIEDALKAERKMREGLEEQKRERREKEEEARRLIQEEEEKQQQTNAKMLGDGRDEAQKTQQPDELLEVEVMTPKAEERTAAPTSGKEKQQTNEKMLGDGREEAQKTQQKRQQQDNDELLEVEGKEERTTAAAAGGESEKKQEGERRDGDNEKPRDEDTEKASDHDEEKPKEKEGKAAAANQRSDLKELYKFPVPNSNETPKEKTI